MAYGSQAHAANALQANCTANTNQLWYFDYTTHIPGLNWAEDIHG
ncbi:hypothetical protein OG767_00320 [Micromonospora sp. NBC_01392]